MLAGFVTSEVNPSVYETGMNRPTHDRKGDDKTDDVAVLNYALRFEHLAASGAAACQRGRHPTRKKWVS